MHETGEQSMKKVISLLVFPIVAFAQSQTGRITGRVTDPAGAVIPNAVVIANDQDTGVTYRGITSGAGVYAVPFLPPGRYRITVSHSGFKTFERPNVALATNEILPL